MAAVNVLIIDDSLTIRAILEQVISADPGFEVVGIPADIVMARKLMASAEPDLVTLDLAMPGLHGLSYLDEIADDWHPPVIVVSSSTPDGSPGAQQAIARGAAACFDKARIVAELPRFLKLLKKTAKERTRRLARPIDFDD